MLLEHPSSERIGKLLLLMANTAAGPWHSALPCASALHHCILHLPRELCPLAKKPEGYFGSLRYPHTLFLPLVLGEIRMVLPSGCGWV